MGIRFAVGLTEYRSELMLNIRLSVEDHKDVYTSKNKYGFAEVKLVRTFTNRKE